MDKGAHFYQCDFQVHTPRDLNWKGSECVSDSDRQKFSTKLIAECRKRKINAIAITDHHDVAFFKYIKTASETETYDNGSPIPENEKIVIFPGIELTLGTPPCQGIIIFDANFPSSELPNILTILAIQSSSPENSKTAQTQPLNKTFQDIYDRLNEHEHLQRKFIIFPHVQDGGHKTLIRKGFQIYFKDIPCVGGYLDGSIEN